MPYENYYYPQPKKKKQDDDGFFDKALDLAKDVAPFVAIAAVTAATMGAGTPAATAAVGVGARAGAATFAKQALVNINAKNLGKASWTVYKRVLGTNLLKAALDDNYNVGDAFSNSFNTTSWIAEGIFLSAGSRALTAPLMNAAKKKAATYGSGGFRVAKNNARNAYNMHVAQLVKAESAKRTFPNLNTTTGELEQTLSRQRFFQDVSRKTQLSFMRPQTKKQEFLGGYIRGARNQAAGTTIFRHLTANPEHARAAWTTKLVQNLDELYLPTTSADSMFQKAYMALRSFDIATVNKSSFGTYSRLNRKNIVTDLYDIAKTSGISPKQKALFSYNALQITPAKLGRLAGAHSVRQVILHAGEGEDKRMQDAYKERNSKKKRHDGGGGSVSVGQYYRDGHIVQAHTRSQRSG